MAKRKAGAPEKLKPAQIIEALRETNGMLYIAAKRLGVCAHTIYDMMRKYPEISAVREELRGQFIDTTESALYRNILEGKEASIIFALKTRARDRGYVERIQNEHGGVGDFDSETPVPTREELIAELRGVLPTLVASNGKANGNGHHHNGNGKH